MPSILEYLLQQVQAGSPSQNRRQGVVSNLRSAAVYTPEETMDTTNGEGNVLPIKANMANQQAAYNQQNAYLQNNPVQPTQQLNQNAGLDLVSNDLAQNQSMRQALAEKHSAMVSANAATAAQNAQTQEAAIAQAGSGTGTGTGKTTSFGGNLDKMIQGAASKYGIPASIFSALVKAESGGNANAKSSCGAIGLTQLMPGTARSLGVNPYNASENLEGGAKYLAQQYKKFGKWDLALAAYNAGPGNVSKYKGVPPFAETRNYVQRVLKLAGQS